MSKDSRVDTEAAGYRMAVEKWYSINGEVKVVPGMIGEERELVYIYLHFRDPDQRTIDFAPSPATMNAGGDDNEGLRAARLRGRSNRSV